MRTAFQGVSVLVESAAITEVVLAVVGAVACCD